MNQGTILYFLVGNILEVLLILGVSFTCYSYGKQMTDSLIARGLGTLDLMAIASTVIQRRNFRISEAAPDSKFAFGDFPFAGSL